MLPTVCLVVQPSVSHYRAPLMKILLESKKIAFSLIGRYTSDPKSVDRDTVASAESSVVDNVKQLPAHNWGVWRWESKLISSVWRREYDAFVLEGRVYTLSTWIALAAGHLRKVPIFLWGHGWKRPEQGLKLRIRRIFYKLSDGLLVYGHAASDYARHVGIEACKVAVVGNSIYSYEDLQIPSGKSPRSRANNEKFNIIVSARLTARHKIHLLADAIARLPNGPLGVHVVIIGDGTERDSLERYFDARGVEAEFVGAVYGAHQLATYYSKAHLAVSPRASGLNIVQALGFGVPVVAPAGDPTSGPESELVRNGQTGALFPLDDVEGFASLIADFLNDPTKLITMGKAGREQIMRTHTAEAHATAIERAIIRFLAD